MSLHLKLTIRQLVKARFFSFINILGLALGIAVSTIILITVIHESKYDRFNEKLDNIYRLEVGDWALMSPNLVNVVSQQFPEIEKTARFSVYEFRNSDIKWQDAHLKIDHFLLSDSGMFDIFSYRLVEGNPSEALATPFSVVLTESTAQSIFGNKEAMGQIIKVENHYDFVVTGIMKDQPFSSMPMQAVGSFPTMFSIRGDRETDIPLTQNMNYQEYILLKEGTDAGQLEDKIHNYLVGLPDFEDLPMHFHLRPLKDIYFSNKIKYEGGSIHGNPQMLKILIVIAVFILLLAVINFINLTTARSGSRARETAVQKVYGAHPGKIIGQYLGESVIVSLTAFIVALLLVELSLPVFARLFEKPLSISLLYHPTTIVIALVAVLMIGIISGLYPAFYMSRYNSLKVMKGELTRGRKGIRIRRYLIISQFIIAAGLIFATQVVHKQVNYMRNMDLGFNKDNIVCVELPAKIRRSRQVFREKLLASPLITGVTFTNALPGKITWQESWEIDGKMHQFTYLPVDENYIDFMGLTLLSGRKFSTDRASDRDSMIIFNETALKEIGVDNPVGYTRTRLGRREEIIGVVKDFHFNSLHAPIAPLALVWRPAALSRVLVKIQPGSEKDVVSVLRDVYSQMAPESLFNYAFLDETFDQLYKNDIRFGKLFNWFTILSIFIAALGLFGMVSFMTVSRRREIAIRKVTGASVTSIMRLYLSEFLLWVLIANLIALPLATYGMKFWLQGFPYITKTGYTFYLLTLFGSIIIAGVTVLWHTFKAGRENPADILKYE